MTSKRQSKIRRMTFQNSHRTTQTQARQINTELREHTNDKIRTTIQRGSLRPKYI